MMIGQLTLVVFGLCVFGLCGKRWSLRSSVFVVNDGSPQKNCRGVRDFEIFLHQAMNVT